ncbi:TadE/TadG family type IV pilus assembly protein [Aliigemmobacter aestuarii]|nr:Tad domain-containing protein [Gemmobacter aestuarii]
MRPVDKWNAYQVAGRLRDGIQTEIRRFASDERGTLTAFALMMTFWMIMVGGLAIDVMRHEQIRTRLQQTLDRSILAAASMSQELDPEDVVEDYFAKADLAEALKTVVPYEGLNFRRVVATAELETNPFFLDLKAYSIDSFIAGAAGSAEQSISKVEIALVLDVSRSMTEYADGTPLPRPNRLENLQDAAAEFAQTILGEDPSNTITMSVVPYNAHVNLGPTLFGQYNTTHRFSMGDPRTGFTPASSFCIDLPMSVYNQAELSGSTAYPQGAFFDAYSSTTRNTSYVEVQAPLWRTSSYWQNGVQRTGTFYLNAACQPMAENHVLVHSNDADAVEAHIRRMISMGGTAIDKGIKWGLALLDENSRNEIEGVINAGAAPEMARGRPADYSANDTMKVIVLMTDGENFEGEQINTAYAGSDLSPIWRSNGDGQLSIRHTQNRPSTAGSNEYWAPGVCESAWVWNGRRWVWKDCVTQGIWMPSAYNSGSGVTRLTWAEVWQEARMQWVAWQLYARALGTNNSSRSWWYDATMDDMRSSISVSDRNNGLQTVCALAKQQGVKMFGIAFEAPNNGKTQIRQCADEGGYFEAEGLEIRTAFRSIASQISQLRLTQ